MFIRKTANRKKTTSEGYFTFRLVASERTGKQVRQITLLNLDRQFDLPRDDWPTLCARIDALLAGQAGMIPDPDSIETLAQRYAARLIAANPAPATAAAASPAQPAAPAAQPALAAVPAAPDPISQTSISLAPAKLPKREEVDIASPQLTRPRSVGVEAIGLAAMDWLGIDPMLGSLGFDGVQRDAVAGLLIGRMVAPGSELATSRWLRERSALGELLGADLPMRLYRTSDLLIRHGERQGRARPIKRETRRLPAGHPRPRPRQQRLRAPLQDVHRQRRRKRHPGGDAQGSLGGHPCQSRDHAPN